MLGRYHDQIPGYMDKREALGLRDPNAKRSRGGRKKGKSGAPA
jgi:hypothetical protein